ncbi:predicted protein [Nematostella vectensis]|uniref:Uncharacterized protein n=1 Tax=Nematostella vectensis TaxID=45351 RepID=A7SH84_NEMVE|nr:predicted protein [Nematostella vectensis]|eukprot:XP_001628978.1 predicted protein [Nematostella vectensis]
MKYYEGKESGVHALVAQKDQPNPAMKWTNAHDTLLDREILTNEPSICRNGSQERGEIWSTIATILNPIEEPVFKVSQRSVRDRYFYTLEKNYKDKVKAEARASGICPSEKTDVDQGVQNIMELFEHDSENQKRSEQKKHTDEDKAKAEEMQKQSLETFKESRKRENNDEPKHKKRKATGSDKMMYLKERGEIKDRNRAEELKLRKAEITEQADARKAELEIKRQELQDRKHKQPMQQQQMQQQQAALMMTLMEKVLKNKKPYSMIVYCFY